MALLMLLGTRLRIELLSNMEYVEVAGYLALAHDAAFRSRPDEQQ